MGDQRHWPARFVAEILVLALLAFAVLAHRFELGERWFGWSAADPRSEPAAVLPPEGLRLPAAVAAEPVARPEPAVPVDAAAVAATVRPLVQRKVLGRRVSVLVTDLATGAVVHRQGAARTIPASTTKILTAAAALESLGPMARFRTAVRWSPESGRLVLVGGGDPFLAATRKAARAAYPDKADLQTLADLTVRDLRERGVSRVRLAYDDTAFTGPAVNPAWPDGYVPEDVVPPISALWVDQGRDPDGPGFVEDPAAEAARRFRQALVQRGLVVRPRVARAVAPPGAIDVARVTSAPLGEIVERLLAVSDNQASEVVARHVGLAERQQGSFVAGAAAIVDVLRRLEVPVAGLRLYDGSGLSRQNLVGAATLTATLRLAASEEHPDLRRVITGLPVAGFTGSLSDRFDRGPAEARGRVRAKTGTLTGVHGLAGVADDVTGARMAFVVVADRVPGPQTLEARLLIDRVAGALAACTCGVGSRS